MVLFIERIKVLMMKFIKFQADFLGFMFSGLCGFIATVALVCFLFISVLGLIQIFTDIEIWKNQIYPWGILFGSMGVAMMGTIGYQIGMALHDWGNE